MDNTDLNKLRRLIKKMEDQPGEAQISFEFIVASLFPDAYEQYQEQITDVYTKGYIEGYTAKLEEKEPKIKDVSEKYS